LFVTHYLFLLDGFFLSVTSESTVGTDMAAAVGKISTAIDCGSVSVIGTTEEEAEANLAPAAAADTAAAVDEAYLDSEDL